MTARSHAKKGSGDPTHYPVDDDMGEGLLHRLIGELLRALVERWLARRRRPALVGANQFIYYEQYNPKAVVAPDVYVLDGVDSATPVTSWKVWETGVVPSIAIEVVSDQPQKDYRDALVRYEDLGVSEVIIFDPQSDESRNRIRWQVWRKGRRGLRQVEVTDDDRVRSKVLGCWLRMTGEGMEMRVRLATGPDGAALLPTETEEERERAEAAEREAAKLRAELDRLRRQR